MSEQVQLGDLAVNVIRKDIKNVHLSVHPPTGRVSIAAPSRMSLEMLRIFAISKLSWIRQRQHKLQNRTAKPPANISTGKAITSGANDTCLNSPNWMPRQSST